MRAEVYHGEPLKTEKSPDIPGIWAEYAPRTNLVWLVFLLKSLLKNRKSEPVATAPTTPARQPLAPCSPNKGLKKQVAKSPLEKIKQQHQQQLEYRPRVTAATQEYISQLKKTLEDRLQAVLELLDLESGHEDMCCAADLVAYAIDTQWLDEKDFF